MDGGWFDALARALAGSWLRSRRGLLGALGAVGTVGIASGGSFWVEDAAAKKNTKQHRKKRQKRKRRRRRRRNNGCSLLPSGAECGEAAQCCSGTCAENTAFPEFDTVCCRAEGESCTIGLNECCQNFMCHCTTGPDCVDFNGSPGVCS